MPGVKGRGRSCVPEFSVQDELGDCAIDPVPRQMTALTALDWYRRLSVAICGLGLFSLHALAETPRLVSEMKSLGLRFALLIESQAIDDSPVWSPDGRFLGINLEGKWSTLNVESIALRMGTWHDRKTIAIAYPPPVLQDISETRRPNVAEDRRLRSPQAHDENGRHHRAGPGRSRNRLPSGEQGSRARDPMEDGARELSQPRAVAGRDARRVPLRAQRARRLRRPALATRHPLHEPEQAHRRDGDGAGDDDAAAVPGLVAERQADEQERDGDDGELAELDAGVE